MKTKKTSFGTLLFIVLLIMLATQGHSQISVYKPFPAYGRWNVETVPGYDPGAPNYTYEIYEANGDTVIGSYTYKIVRLSQVTYTPTSSPPYSPWAFSFAYRNDIPAKRVYIYTNIPDHYEGSTFVPAHDQDTLFYDFNLSVGDTLKETFAFHPAGTDSIDYERRIVSSIDSVAVCGQYHKRFQFNCNIFNTQLVEGMGFADHFMHTFETCPFEPAYLSTTTFSCTLTSADELQTTPAAMLHVFPNPAGNALQISNIKNITLPFDYYITDCLGKTVNKGIATDNTPIDISALQNGLYFLTVSDKSKNTFQSKFLKQ